MKKLFRHVAGVIIFSFVACLFLPFSIYAGEPTSTEVFSTNVVDMKNGYFSQYRYFCNGYDSSVSPVVFYIDSHDDDHANVRLQYFIALTNTRLMFDFESKYYAGSSSDKLSYQSSSTSVGGSFFFEDATGNRHYYLYGPTGSADSLTTWTFSVAPVEVSSLDELRSILLNDDISDYLPVNTDNYSLNKSLGHVTNAKWKHLVSNDLKSQVVSDGFGQYGVGVDGTAKMDSYTYSRYSLFSKDKCSFATKSSTGLNLLESRYQLQYCSRVQMTFHYNLLGVIPTDNTKDYTKRFTSPKPYPAVDGCSFDAAKNIESLFSQGFAYNESLPAFGTALRNFLFDETKYWIDVRIVDKKTHTYGAWYAMALEDNKARVITTDDGDIGSDVDSEEDVGNYTKIEGTGDTFDDAEDNSHEVKDTEQFSKDKWTDASKGVKDSYSTAKSLIKMVAGLPQMIGTLFSWLPSWCLSLVAVFFSIIIVLALLRFILGS